MTFAIFMVVVFCLYWAIPHKFRWILLFVSSYYFYMSWNPKYVVLILLTTVVSYVAGILLERAEKATIKKFIVAITLIICFGVLFFFKYFNFFSESVTNVLRSFSLHVNPVMLNVLLPVGISFYTFQTLGYVIDVYRGTTPAEHHFGIYATFISFFPQLVAGPIERSNNLLPQIKSEKTFDYDTAMYGMRQMLWGFFKKIAVADVVAVYVDAIYGDLTSSTGFDMAIAISFFTVQIYCDFSGYSDIAIGTAKLLGVELMQNFKSPYFSKSIKEFWSRWHISLSTCFRDYVYIPMGGNRCSRMRCSFNLLTTFLLSGLWHGANWTFVFWGLLHGIAQVLESTVFKIKNKTEDNKCKKVVKTLLVFVFANITWVFFRAESISDAFYVLKSTFVGVGDLATYLHTNLGPDRISLLFILVTIIIVAIFDWISLTRDVIYEIGKWQKPIRVTIEYVIIVFIGIALINSTGSNQFVYFQF